LSESLLDIQEGLSTMELIISDLMQKGPLTKCDLHTLYGMYWA
jgi:hypothetical protein